MGEEKDTVPSDHLQHVVAPAMQAAMSACVKPGDPCSTAKVSGIPACKRLHRHASTA